MISIFFTLYKYHSLRQNHHITPHTLADEHNKQTLDHLLELYHAFTLKFLNLSLKFLVKSSSPLPRFFSSHSLCDLTFLSFCYSCMICLYHCTFTLVWSVNVLVGSCVYLYISMFVIIGACVWPIMEMC